jgi:hypothetical protein
MLESRGIESFEINLTSGKLELPSSARNSSDLSDIVRLWCIWLGV